MKGQLQRLGISYAWDREIATCLPEYYKFNQWIFLKMFERGLAYRKRSTVNWCPSCQTVLANEQVVDGACWRCGTTIVTRDLEQWFFRITAYAEELLKGLDTLTEWPEKVVVMQRNWIGRSEGARLRFPVARRAAAARASAPPARPSRSSRLESTPSTARRSCCWRPSIRWSIVSPRKVRIRRAFARASRVSRARSGGAADGGHRKGRLRHRTNGAQPVHKQEVPIWVANFVLAEYGTGAIMAVPAHDQRDFEFARKYRLPITIVVVPADHRRRRGPRRET